MPIALGKVAYCSSFLLWPFSQSPYVAPSPMGLDESCNPVCVLSFWEEEGIDLALLQPPCLAVSLAVNNFQLFEVMKQEGERMKQSMKSEKCKDPELKEFLPLNRSFDEEEQKTVILEKGWQGREELGEIWPWKEAQISH
ncbi:hypothetical protein AAG906_013403 [Vitis piasezkii]